MDVNLQIDSPFLSRLLDVVASGIGAIFRPWMIRRLAHANVDAKLIEVGAEWSVRQMDTAMRQAEPNGLASVQALDAMDSIGDLTPEARTNARFQFQEAKRQRNTELVVLRAASEPGDPPPEEAPDEDWVARFFGAIQDVSSEEMQVLWGRILAGEVRRPGTYSLRTIDVLRNLTRQEAKVLSAVSGCFEESTGVLLFGSDSGSLLPPNLGRLVEAGLLHARSMWKLQSPRTMALTYLDGSFTVSVKGPGFMDRYDPTQATAEILSVIERTSPRGYLDALKRDLRRAGYEVEETF